MKLLRQLEDEATRRKDHLRRQFDVMWLNVIILRTATAAAQQQRSLLTER